VEMRRDTRELDASQLVILQQVCHAFGSTARWSEARDSVVRWVRAAAGLSEGSGSVRVLLPDSAGRLHRVWRTDDPIGEGRKRSAQRRMVFQTKVSMRVPLDDPSGMDLLIQPLVCRGNPVGIMEVEAPRASLTARRKTIEAVAGLVAVVLRNIQSHQEALGREREPAPETTRDLELGLMWTAHELRAPLLGVKAAIDQALMSQEDAPGRAAFLRESSAELSHLADSIEPLLRLAIGGGAVGRQPANLSAEVLEAIEERPRDIDRRRLRITGSSEAGVRVNRDLLRRAIANMIINALMYSPPGSRVRVSIEEHAGRASVRVVNRGSPRMSSSEQQTLFDPFVRGRSVAWATRGHGLGLSIARRIVEAHGGVIWWRSTRDYTTFCIELPAEPTTERLRAEHS
jgi:K+-sensing histidine kinase KdpD